MQSPPPDELEALRLASAGLEYPSETDVPFEPFHWPAGRAGEAARDAVAARAGPGDPIVDLSVEAFFAPLARTSRARSFRRLRRVVEATLGGPTGFRVGEVRVQLYLIGRTRSGDWAGLRTSAVET